MSINATVWQPQLNQGGDYDSSGNPTLVEEDGATTIVAEDGTTSLIAEDSTFTNISNTVWTDDEGA